MATYLLLLGGADVDKRSGNAEIAPEMYERFARWLDGLKKNGHYVTSHKLRDQTGARLTVRGGQVVEGPFMETKEAVGGHLRDRSRVARGRGGLRARLPDAHAPERLRRGARGRRGPAPCD